jgi:hypothetical protein
MGQTHLFSATKLAALAQSGRTRPQIVSRSEEREVKNMLGIVAAVLIVLWLLGCFAFQITTAVINAALIARQRLKRSLSYGAGR